MMLNIVPCTYLLFVYLYQWHVWPLFCSLPNWNAMFQEFFGSDSKESACNGGDPGSIPGSRISPGEGNGYPLQYCCLENSMVRESWWATVHGVAKSRTWLSDMGSQSRTWLSDFTFTVWQSNSTTRYQYLLTRNENISIEKLLYQPSYQHNL